MYEPVIVYSLSKGEIIFREGKEGRKGEIDASFSARETVKLSIALLCHVGEYTIHSKRSLVSRKQHFTRVKGGKIR